LSIDIDRILERLSDLAALEDKARADFNRMGLHDNSVFHGGRESGVRDAIDIIRRMTEGHE
jgi:hypothetical protein